MMRDEINDRLRAAVHHFKTGDGAPTVSGLGGDWATTDISVSYDDGYMVLHLKPLFPVTDLTAAVWSGEGLPPVGCVCENLAPGRPRPWTKVTIVGIDRDRVIYRLPDGTHSSDPVFLEGSSDKPLFRPLRTAEQLAAEVREAEVNRLCKVVMAHKEYHYYNRNVGCSAALRFAVEAIVDSKKFDADA